MQHTMNIKKTFAEEVIQIINKPYYGVGDISALLDRKNQGSKVFREIIEHIKTKYPDYYNRQSSLKKVPRSYALEYLKKYYGFDADDHLKWHRKISDIT